mmetsp:Transcript_38988/g.74762  ORF Transcript_38988/g.74762 Transcript_38988/m.74762 type:complete len:657 (-) Transcript_38988:49-2019(-)
MRPASPEGGAVGKYLVRSHGADGSPQDGKSPGTLGAVSESDTSEPKVRITPLDTVYSYFMFMMPIEACKSPGAFTWNKFMALGLVFMTFLLQAIVLYAIYKEVVAGDTKWRNSIVGIDPEPGQCNPGGALCTMEGGDYTCAPPSVQLTGRWDELDTDGDGIWTRSEVEAAADTLQCKYVVNPVEVFDVFVTFLKKRENFIWLHPELKAGNEIRKAYFTYAAGDLIMCGYRNEQMCPNLLTRGIFDAPLKFGTAPRVGTTINSALDYCHGLLEEGGTCERTLPSTYSAWKKASVDQCLGEQYSKAVYEHPLQNTTKSMLKVDYEARKDYTMAAKSLLFFIYKMIIIGMFLLAMFAEMKDITTYVTWVAKFPSEDDFSGEGVYVEKDSEEDEERYVIQGISSAHRCTVGLLTLGRALMIIVLTMVGVTFLQKDTDWVNLLLNAVALVFVVEIANNLYGQVLHTSLRELCENTEPMEVSMWGPLCLNANPALKDAIGAILLLLVIAGVMLVHFYFVGKPLAKALECACLSQGDSCHEADAFSNDFWDKYWLSDVPRVLQEIQALKLATVGPNNAAGLLSDDNGGAPYTPVDVGSPLGAPPAPAAAAVAHMFFNREGHRRIPTYRHHRRLMRRPSHRTMVNSEEQPMPASSTDWRWGLQM